VVYIYILVLLGENSGRQTATGIHEENAYYKNTSWREKV